MVKVFVGQVEGDSREDGRKFKRVRNIVITDEVRNRVCRYGVLRQVGTVNIRKVAALQTLVGRWPFVGWKETNEGFVGLKLKIHR